MTKIKYLSELILEWSINYEMTSSDNEIKKQIVEFILDRVMPDIGNIPISSLDFQLSQHLLTFLNGKKTRKGYYVAKENIKYILYNYGITYSYIRNQLKYSSSQLSNIYKRREVTIACAEKFSNLVKIPVEELFDDNTYEEDYERHYISEYRQAMRKIFKYGYEKNLLMDDYSKIVLPTTSKQTIKPTPSNIQFDHFISNLVNTDNLRTKTILLTFIECNLNSPFICNIRWEDIDFNAHLIRFNPNFQKCNRSLHQSTENVLISPMLEDTLKKYKNIYFDNFEIKNEYLFTTLLNRKFDTRKVRKIFYDFKVKIKCFGITIDSLREYIKQHGPINYDNYIENHKVKTLSLINNDVKKNMKILGFDNVYEYFDYLEYLEALNFKKEIERE